MSSPGYSFRARSPKLRSPSNEKEQDRTYAHGPWLSAEDGGSKSPPPQGSYDCDRLGAHYIPDKLATSTREFGAEARRRSRHAAGWGAAAGRSARSYHDSVTYSFEDEEEDGLALVPVDALSDVRGTNSTSERVLTASPGVSRRAGGKRESMQSGKRTSMQQRGANDETGTAKRYGTTSSKKALSPVQPESFIDDKIEQAQDQAFNSLGAASHQKGTTLQHEESRDLSNSGGSQPPVLQERRSIFHRWSVFKWCLVVGNTTLTAYAVAGFVMILLAWANYYTNASIFLIINRREIILCTVAASICLVASLIGWVGILLNNREFLAVYTLFLWIALILAVTPGYMTYKRRTFNLPGKMNHLWSRELNLDERRLIQVVLQCCGYYSPFIEAVSDSGRCYARSTLPGCKGPLIDLERRLLSNVYAVIFTLVGPHLLVIVIALLCSNHITYRFGKGKTPKPYRLDIDVLRQAFEKQLLETTTDRRQAWERSSTGSLPRRDIPLPPPKPHFWTSVT